jgi:putative glutamine amidotransferase
MSAPRIGISACFFHPDPERIFFKGKTLLYLEEGMSHYVMAAGGYPVMVPTAGPGFTVSQIVNEIDGLVLHGGSDVAPQSYGEEPIDPRWPGDPIRDAYEIALVNELKGQGKPVFGICRGVQVLNVALGGTLYQDIATQKPAAQMHRSQEMYDQLGHGVRIVPGSRLHALYETDEATINSVHHQAIKDVAPGLEVEARSIHDDIVEAVRYLGDDAWLMVVQWHPEIQPARDPIRLPRQPLVEDFMAAVVQRRSVA